ncbi:type 1 glutamine amidotransferase [Leifsonia sp. EB41]|uniref:ThuA domain-containing protein n=1 Tax=Leifsonia sp. EB41 TaxID=3156260 RepID=UPI0035195DBF
MTTIVTLAGEGEYESDVTMRPVAEGIARDLGATLDYRTTSVIEDVPDFPESSFGGLDALADADLLLLYTRFRVLPDDEVAALAAYLERGGAVVALRTSNHAFHPVAGSAWESWTAGFARRYLGSAWSTHHGHTSRTRVEVVADDPITAGLPAEFEVDSWLYVNEPPAAARVLLAGDPIDPEIDPQPSPVAWAWDDRGRRVFYTSLGSQSDLERPEVLRLLTQASRWAIEGDR